MALKLAVNNPAYPAGEELEVAGVLVNNGGDVTLTESQEATFWSAQGEVLKDSVSSDDANVKVTGTATFTAPEDVSTEPAAPPPPEEEPPPEGGGS